MEKAKMVKEDFRYNYPDLNDFELATDYFEILADGGATSFRRFVSVKIPTSVDGFTEDNRYTFKADTQIFTGAFYFYYLL